MSGVYRLFSRYWTVPATLCVVVDLLVSVACFHLAYAIRFWNEPAFFTSSHWLRSFVFCSVISASLYLGGLYDLRERKSARRWAVELARGLAAASLVLLAVYYGTYDLLTPGRGVFVIALGLAAVVLAAWRLLIFQPALRRLFREKLLIVGDDQLSRDLARAILTQKHLGYEVVGFITDDPSLQGVSLVNPRVIGTCADLQELAVRHGVHRVIVGQVERRGKLDLDSLLKCKTSGIPVGEGADFYERITGRIFLQSRRVKSDLVFSDGFVVKPMILRLKRLLDLVVALIGLAVALPIGCAAAAAIRLDSRGPVFFHQERVGRHGRTYRLWKFRSMRSDAEADGTARWATENDPRVTRVGRLLRKTRIDELPQLWNVLRGDMSLVGPRPERPEFVAKLTAMEPMYSQRLVLRPGITGWAQIRAPYAASVEESLEKLEYDLYYIRALSIFLDLSILASTARTVLVGRGAR